MKYLDILETSNYWGAGKLVKSKPRPDYVNWLVDQSETTTISAVIGVRRSGKSTILRQVIHELISNKQVNPKNTLFINFEDPRLINLLTGNDIFSLIEDFKHMADLRSRMYLVMDEVQNLVNWESIIRTIQDQDPQIKLYITGSSAKLLGKELGTKLTGRYITTEVFPLSFIEYKNFTSKGVVQYVNEGGFPDSVLTKKHALQEQLLKDYYESILLRDITARYGIRNEFKLRRLSAQLFANIANQASSYKISKDLNVSSDTVLQYFEYIEDAYLGFFVPKFAHSVRKQNYNPKKFYCIDNGLQSAVSFRVIDDLGKLFENTVFLTIRRYFDQVFYWEEKKEIDFVVKHKDTIKLLINVSVSIVNESTRQREINALMEGMFSLQKSRGILVVLEGKAEVIETDVGEITVMTYAEFDFMMREGYGV